MSMGSKSTGAFPWRTCPWTLAYGERPGTGPCDERLATYISAERELRRTRFGHGPFLIIQVQGNVDVDEVAPVYEAECPDFVYRHNGTPKEGLRAAAEPQVRAIVAGLALAEAEVFAAEKV